MLLQRFLFLFFMDAHFTKLRHWLIYDWIISLTGPLLEIGEKLRAFTMIYLLCCHKSQTALFLGFLERQMVQLMTWPNGF